MGWLVDAYTTSLIVQEVQSCAEKLSDFVRDVCWDNKSDICRDIDLLEDRIIELFRKIVSARELDFITFVFSGDAGVDIWIKIKKVLIAYLFVGKGKVAEILSKLDDSSIHALLIILSCVPPAGALYGLRSIVEKCKGISVDEWLASHRDSISGLRLAADVFKAYVGDYIEKRRKEE